jgi:hypothetical protein
MSRVTAQEKHVRIMGLFANGGKLQQKPERVILYIWFVTRWIRLALREFEAWTNKTRVNGSDLLKHA